jgi:hypothetical protein
MHAQTPPVAVRGLEGMSGHLVSRRRFYRQLNTDSVAQPAHSTRPRLAQGIRRANGEKVWCSVASKWPATSKPQARRMACHEQASGASNGLP